MLKDASCSYQIPCTPCSESRAICTCAKPDHRTNLGMPKLLFGAAVIMYSLMLIGLPTPSFFPVAVSDAKLRESQATPFTDVHGRINGVKMQYQCLSQSSLSELIGSIDQVIMTMPAKAAGTAMHNFAKQCTRDSGLTVDYIDNMLNFKDANHFDGILSKSFQMPPVLSSHMYTMDNFLYLIKNVPRSTLLVYVHREETSRVQSAVNEVVTNWCRRGNGYPNVHLEPPIPDFFDEEDGSTCHVSEKNLIEYALGEKGMELEIGLGATKLLHCETYESILEYAPNMIFMNYKMANELQELISEKFCPDLEGEPIASNVGSEKETKTFVRVENGDKSSSDDFVVLRDWLKAKQNTLEWALGLNDKATCTANTRVMEDKLYGCEYGFIKAAVVEG